MAINFPDSPSNGDTTTLAGKTYTFDSSKSKWSPSGAVTLSSLSVGAEATASGDGGIAYNNGSGVFTFTPAVAAGTGVTVYASQSAMLAADASSAVTEGSLHYDTGANKLYVKMADAASGGFYLLASIINASPSISSPSTGTAFELDGTPNPTTISIAASDSDAGQTLNYYYAVSTGSIGSGTTVTTSATSSGTYASSGNAVAGSSNASTNSHFRINPSNSVATNFSLTFYVTDGTNISNTICSFSLNFITANSRHTSLLMSANAAGNNSTFTDSSSSAHTITPSGDPTQGSFSPYRKGGYSMEVSDNKNDFFYVPDDGSFNFGTGDFTYETWVYFTSAAGGEMFISAYADTTSQSGTTVFSFKSVTNVTSTGFDGKLALSIWYQGWKSDAPATTFNFNEWIHVAAVRESGYAKFYKNGTQVGSDIADTTNYYNAGQNVSFGRIRNGYVYNGRVSNIARTISGNVPTEDYVYDSNTVALQLNKPYFAYQSSSSVSIPTIAGSPKIAAKGPFDYGEVDVTDGGSIEFDGTGDALTLASGSITAPTGNFNLQFWVYPKSNSSNISIYDSAFANGGIVVFYHSSQTFYVFLGANTGSNHVTLNGPAASAAVNSWHHICVTRNGSNLKLFVNGKEIDTSSNSITFAQAAFNATTIGMRHTTSNRQYFNGLVSDLKFDSSNAITGEFTPPTEPLSSSGADVHLKGQGAKIFDKSQTANAEIYGNTAATTVTHTNFDPQSVYFDASSTSQHITWRENISLAGEFTVEGWFNPSQFSKVPWCVGQYRIQLLLKESTSRVYRASGGWQDFSHSTLSSGNWYHIALCRNSSNQIQMWFDGVRSSQTLNDSQTFNGDFLVLGGEANAAGTTAGDAYQGYIQDFRVSNIARYSAADETGNIPTSPLKG